MPNDASKIASLIDKTEDRVSSAEGDILKAADLFVFGFAPFNTCVQNAVREVKRGDAISVAKSIAPCLKALKVVVKNMEQQSSSIDKSMKELNKAESDLKKLKAEMKKLVSLP